MKVACVEKRANKALGGTCLNVGCIPQQGAARFQRAVRVALHKLARHGISVGERRARPRRRCSRARTRSSSELTDGIAFLFKKNKVTPVYGTGKLLDGGKVEVTAADGKKTTLKAKHILLATGSEAIELPFLKFDGKHVVSSTEALTFDAVPKHLIVVGGGYIGLELGSVWKRLGAKVTVLEFLPRILPICRRRGRGRGAEAAHEAGDRVPPRHEGDRGEGQGRRGRP